MELGKIIKIEYEYTNLVEGDRPHREYIILDDKILEISKHHIYGESDIHIYKLRDTKLIDMVNEIGINEEPFIYDEIKIDYGDIVSFCLTVTYENGSKTYKGKFPDDMIESFVKILGRLREYLRYKAFSINFEGLEQVLGYKDDYFEFKTVNLIDLKTQEIIKEVNTHNLNVKYGDIVNYVDESGCLREGKVNFVYEQNKKDFCAYLHRNNNFIPDDKKKD